jgi:hypothetical protein
VTDRPARRPALLVAVLALATILMRCSNALRYGTFGRAKQANLNLIPDRTEFGYLHPSVKVLNESSSSKNVKEVTREGNGAEE